MNPNEPRFATGVVHGFHILKGGQSVDRHGAHAPLPEWHVTDRAFDRVVANFSRRDGEARAKALADALNEEDETRRATPGFEPRFQKIIDDAIDKSKRGAQGRAARMKGRRAEREAALLFLEHGYEVDNLEARGDHLIKGHVFGDLHGEVKRQEALEIMKWMRQAIAEAQEGRIPIVAFRRSRDEWFVVMRLDDFIKGGRAG